MPVTKYQKLSFSITLLILVIFGDIFDSLVFIGETAVLLTWIRRSQKINPESSSILVTTVIFQILQICSIGTLNRVNGYPDKEIWQYLIPLGYFFLQILLIILVALRKIHIRPFLIALALIFLPLTELPTLALRTVITRPFLKGIPPGTHIVYISHVGFSRIFAVSQLDLQKNSTQKMKSQQTLVVSTFTRTGTEYSFESNHWLLINCSGTMDCQTPNVPWLIWKLIQDKNSLSPQPESATSHSLMNQKFKKPDDTTLKQKLSPLQYQVTQQEATEPPFRNEFWDKSEDGLYVDIVSGEPLFSSLDKFDSGCGWPSFTKPLKADAVQYRDDHKLLRPRTEVRSQNADSHLGHVFDDGPGPLQTRFCINSAALRFIPARDLEKEGYGEYAALFVKKPAEVAVLAGGCFWGVEQLLRDLHGVINTEVGYTGGTTPNPVYDQVKTGKTGHAEAIEVTFDPAKISYADILRYFFRLHDPTTPNRQGNDIGTQYRSAIFYKNDEQRRIAEEIKREVDASKKWTKPIATEIVAATPFYPAEEDHQDYLIKNPGGYMCHFLRD